MKDQDKQNQEINNLEASPEKDQKTIDNLKKSQSKDNYNHDLVGNNDHNQDDNVAIISQENNKRNISIVLSEDDYEYPIQEELSLLPKLKFLGIVAGVSGVFVLTGLFLGLNDKNSELPNITNSKSSLTNFQSGKTLPSPIATPSLITPISTTTLSSQSICAPDTLLKTKVKNWASPTILTLSKNIIIASGHDGLNDIRKPNEPILKVEDDGTNGLIDKPVHYQGKYISLEAAVNLRTVEKIQSILEKVGFNVQFVRAESGENLRSKMERIKKMVAETGAFAFEVHYDDPKDNSKQSGAGVIPPNIDHTLTAQSTYADVITSEHLTREGISGYDIALASKKAFGAYPQDWRNGLGGPRRGITLLEIDRITKIEKPFRRAIETNKYSRVDKILDKYAQKVADVFIRTYNKAKNSSSAQVSSTCYSHLSQYR